jgi:SAM-dependent methyltransferase
MYDYYLGGFHNFQADRDAAQAAEAAYPGTTASARLNRDFLRRAVRYCMEQGIDQFLDLGSGVPTVGNVHEIAQRVNPAARVAYVDIEPVAVKTSELLLAHNPTATVIQADLRDHTEILTNPRIRGLIDFDRPVGVLMVSVLHFVPDADDPAGIVAAYRDALAPGGYLVLSHAGVRGDEDERGDLLSVYSRSTSPLTLRRREEVAPFFAGLELVEPGLCQIFDWRPEGTDAYAERWRDRLDFTCGIGRKPA